MKEADWPAYLAESLSALKNAVAGVPAAALTPPIDTDEVDALLAYLGRRAGWNG